MRALLLATLLCGLATAGCASKPYTDQVRQAPAGIGAGERIAIVLSSYERKGVLLAAPGQNPDELRELQQISEELESCVRDAMAGKQSALLFVPSADARAALFPGKTINELPGEPAQWLPEQADAAAAERLTAQRLRYVIALKGRWSTSEGEVQVAAERIGGAVGYEWKRFSSLGATVLDLPHRRIVGELFASSDGRAGWGVGLLLIIPFPIFYASDPQARACRALGEALSQFIIE